MRGRKPVPTALKVVRGNPGRRPLPPDEPVPPAAELHCPPELKGRARKYWNKRAPVLLEAGLLTVVDTPLLAEMCETEAEYWDARDDVRKNGQRLIGYTEAGQVHRENPCVKIGSDAQKRLKALRVEFGMSPSSRTRVKAAPKPEKKSALEELRDRRKA